MCSPHGIFSCTLGNGCRTELTMFCVSFCLTFRAFFPTAPRHLVGNLPPYTNVSLKMILTNPEGRKESDETIIQTDEDGGIDKAHYLHCILGPLNVCFHSFLHIIKSHYICVDFDSCRGCSQSVSESYSIRRHNHALLERTL